MSIERFAVGDKISFYCGGRGRGGHVVALCTVIKVNRKTVLLEEGKPSYSPGQQWRCNPDWLIENLTARGMTITGYNTKF